MSVRNQEADEEKGMGVLKLDPSTKETLEAFGVRMVAATEKAREQIAQSQQAMRADPVFIEHQAREGRE